MVIRRVCGVVVGVYLALILVIPSRLTYIMATNFFCGCSGETICRLGGSRACVLANVDVRHRRQVGQDQGSSSRSLY